MRTRRAVLAGCATGFTLVLAGCQDRFESPQPVTEDIDTPRTFVGENGGPPPVTVTVRNDGGGGEFHVRLVILDGADEELATYTTTVDMDSDEVREVTFDIEEHPDAASVRVEYDE